MAEGAEFGAGATLTVEVDPRSLAKARAEIEDEIGDVMVDVEGGAGGALADGGVGGAAAFDSTAMVDELGNQTDILENIYDELDGGIAVGGGSGQGGGTVDMVADYLAVSKVADLVGKGGAGAGILSMLTSSAGVAGLAGLTSIGAGMGGMGGIMEFFNDPPGDYTGGVTAGWDSEQAASDETVEIGGEDVPIQNIPSTQGIWNDDAGTMRGNEGPGDFDIDEGELPELDDESINKLDMTSEEYQEVADVLKNMEVPEPGWTSDFAKDVEEIENVELPEPAWLDTYHETIREAEKSETGDEGGGDDGADGTVTSLPPGTPEDERRQYIQGTRDGSSPSLPSSAPKSDRRRQRTHRTQKPDGDRNRAREESDRRRQERQQVDVNARVEVKDDRTRDEVARKVSDEVQRQIKRQMRR
ncbi:MAG: hypothetical protein ACOCY1_02840 [Halovenus sp.]